MLAKILCCTCQYISVNGVLVKKFPALLNDKISAFIYIHCKCFIGICRVFTCNPCNFWKKSKQSYREIPRGKLCLVISWLSLGPDFASEFWKLAPVFLDWFWDRSQLDSWLKRFQKNWEFLEFSDSDNRIGTLWIPFDETSSQILCPSPKIQFFYLRTYFGQFVALVFPYLW